MSNKTNYYSKKKWNNKNKKKTTNPKDKSRDNTRSSPKSPTGPIVGRDDSDLIKNFIRKSDNPLHGWKLFFDDKEYQDDSRTVKKVKTIMKFVRRHESLSMSISYENLENGIPFNVDVQELYDSEIIQARWADFKLDLQDNATHTLNCLRLAIHQLILKTVAQEVFSDVIDSLITLPIIRLKILNYQPLMYLRDLRFISYGKLISTRGCVIRVNQMKHRGLWVVFFCSECKSQKICKQPQGIYTVSKKCDTCKSSKFTPVLNSPYMKSIPYQEITIQELFGDEQDNKGRTPRTLLVELMDDLVNTCMPGDDINLTGVIKIRNFDEQTNNKKNMETGFSLYMEAVTIINHKNSCKTKNLINSEMNSKDYTAIKEVHDQANLFTLLIHSLCPGIYGHEMIKAGLILSLFGGNMKCSDLRDDIHVLMVGDPGLGKSQMLQACSRVAPKGVYICGNSSTSSGLTVTLKKEPGTNDFILEPGALVLADKGTCCIDEFDKMTNQHQALLEAMEQQSVSVAKSGTVCSLPARTSILAAANPIGGRWDRSKAIRENLSMSSPLLSRFDLIFFILDQPNKQFDDLLCKHVMNFHARSSRKRKNMNDDHLILTTTQESSLRERLSSFSGKSINAISHSILRKYISYAQEHVKPTLSQDAVTVLHGFYLELRYQRRLGVNGLPVYIRQLEAMIRLTEARAKLELRTIANESDALEVVEILRYTMTDIFNDDVRVELNASSDGKLTNKKMKLFITLLKKQVMEEKDKLFSRTELKEIAQKGGVVVDDFTALIEKLNEKGVILKTQNMYKLIPD